MKRVYVAKNPADAHLLKGFLESEEIEAVVRGEFLWGVRGEVPLTADTSPSVWVVDDADFDRAMELVSGYRSPERTPPSGKGEWRCAGCGEANEAPFTECWRCGASRPVG